MRIVEQEGFVLQAVHGKLADGPYYLGDGEWGPFEAAQVYYTRRAMRAGLREAKRARPDDAAEICAFGVFV